ncbi:MAG: ATP-binding protein [Anaerosomatales bacterium]|nr:ATP-binding protein [Anaerosomatales bacterium]
MSDTTQDKAPRLQWIPPTLQGRLSVTVALAAIGLFFMVFGGMSWITARQAGGVAAADARHYAMDLSTRIGYSVRELESYVVAYTEWDDFYDRTVQPDPAFVVDEVDPWLAEQSGATAVLWTDLDGTAIYSLGSEADVAALSDIAFGASEGLAGPTVLPSGSAIVVSEPVIGDAGMSPAGYLAIARPLDGDELSPYSSAGPVIRATTLSELPDLDTANGWRQLTVEAGYIDELWTRHEGDSVHVVARLTGGVDAPAGVVEAQLRDAWSEATGGPAGYLTPLLLAAATLGLALALGLGLAHLIQTPINEYIAYLREQGHAAIEGKPTEEALAVDPLLPVEFRDLGGVIQDLLASLQQRQALLKHASEQALAAEQAFRSVVDESSEVKMLLRDGVVEVANPAAGRCLGRPLGSLLREPLDAVLAPMRIFTESGEAIDAHLLVEQALGGTVTVRCAQHDEDRWMEVSVAHSALAPDVLLFSARDVTEQRRLDALRREIVSVVSHDLRAPLTVMSGYLDILERDIPEDLRANAIAKARSAADRMSSLLDDLLDAARAEQGLAPTHLEPVSLGEMADEIAASLRVTADHDIIVIKRRDATVLGDGHRLRQALTNLVVNAIKYTPKGTEIEIAVDTDDEQGVVSVEDQGDGIAPEDRERVFERYERLGDEKRGSGMGLGLYIVKAVVEGHHGSVSVEEGRSGGARFVVRLPLA